MGGRISIDHLVLSNLKDIEMGSGKLSQFSEIAEEVNNGIKRSDLIDSNRTFLTEHIKKIRGKICVSIEVIAEDENKYKEAWIEFENIINLLRIYSSCQIGDCGLKIGLSEDFLTQIIL